MAELRELFIEAGCKRVTTYIQSGNVVFTHPTRSPEKLRVDLERRIEEATGFDVPVILRSGREWAAIVRNNPFVGVEPTKLLVAFLGSDPPAGALDAIDPDAFAPVEFVLRGREVYLHLPAGMARAKLPQALGVLQAPATSRNWRTVMKLLELAAE